MNKEFIPYEEALVIEKLGYDEDDFIAVWYYRLDGKALILDSAINDYSYMAEKWLKIPALTYSQAFRWFRDKYKLCGDVRFYERCRYSFLVHDIKYCEKSDTMYIDYESYEEAELACLKKLIEIVKNK
jgi:hypothetical protein